MAKKSKKAASKKSQSNPWFRKKQKEDAEKREAKADTVAILDDDETVEIEMPTPDPVPVPPLTPKAIKTKRPPGAPDPSELIAEYFTRSGWYIAKLKDHSKISIFVGK